MSSLRGLTGVQLSMEREHTALARSHPDLFTGSLGRSIFTPSELSALNVILIKCGTRAGYRQHQRERSLPCGDCHRAFEDSPGKDSRHRDSCGSNTGWLAHRRNEESPCGPCRAARDRHVEDLHGTYAGWMLHRRMGTAACTPCITARNTYQNSRPRKSRARA